MYRHLCVIFREFNICSLLSALKYFFWSLFSDVSVPDQHNKNINKGVYMRPQIHTACTRYYNVEQILLYQ